MIDTTSFPLTFGQVTYYAFIIGLIFIVSYLVIREESRVEEEKRNKTIVKGSIDTLVNGGIIQHEDFDYKNNKTK